MYVRHSKQHARGCVQANMTKVYFCIRDMASIYFCLFPLSSPPSIIITCSFGLEGAWGNYRTVAQKKQGSPFPFPPYSPVRTTCVRPCGNICEYVNKLCNKCGLCRVVDGVVCGVCCGVCGGVGGALYMGVCLVIVNVGSLSRAQRKEHMPTERRGLNNVRK